ncbi:MAG: hypothetical protein F4Y03_00465 [Alphaproteobacteria bacterium]|nr:hypothetical protein [Alphaproteobacteria bacterium]
MATCWNCAAPEGQCRCGPPPSKRGSLESLLREAGHEAKGKQFGHLHRRWAAALGAESWSEVDTLALLVELAWEAHHAPEAGPAHGYRRERPAVSNAARNDSGFFPRDFPRGGPAPARPKPKRRRRGRRR